LAVAKDDFRLLDLAFFLDENLLGTIDHDVADLVILEQELERAEAEGLVEDLVDQALAFVAVQQRVLGIAEMLDNGADLVAQGLRVHLADPVHVEPVHELDVDMPLERHVLLDGRVYLLDRFGPSRRLRRRSGNPWQEALGSRRTRFDGVRRRAAAKGGSWTKRASSQTSQHRNRLLGQLFRPKKRPRTDLFSASRTHSMRPG